MRLVQKTCNDDQRAQMWLTPPAPAAGTTTSSATRVQGAVGPDPAEYPGSGEDQQCEGISPVLRRESTE